MISKTFHGSLAAATLFFLSSSYAPAHVAPPLVLLSEEAAISAMTAGASKVSAREVRMTAEQRDQVTRRSGWKPGAKPHRLWLAEDEAGKVVTAVVFVEEFTIHGPLRVAVALDPEGKIRDARVTELTEETYPWLKPLVDRRFLRALAGLDSQATFTVDDDVRKLPRESMPRFFAEAATDLVRRAAILYEVTMIESAK